MKESPQSEVARDLDLDELRYSSVWEDERLLRQSLQIEAKDDVLAIASAGDNAFSLLLEGPRRVVAVDMSRAQLALVELKVAAIQHLEHSDFVALIGVRPHPKRHELFAAIADHLSPASRAYWEAHPEMLQKGAARQGKLDRYFAAFAEQVLSKLWPEDLVQRMYESGSLSEQALLFQEHGDTPELSAGFRAFFNRQRVEASGRDAAQFRYVDESEMDHLGALFDRFRKALNRFELKSNFYMERFLTGRTRDLNQGPAYLRPGNYQRLRDLLPRLELVHAELEAHLCSLPDGTYSKAALSDVFEYMAFEDAFDVYRALLRKMRAGGLLAYWNFLVPRSAPESLRGRLVPLPEVSGRLQRRDRAFLYRAFHVEEIGIRG